MFSKKVSFISFALSLLVYSTVLYAAQHEANFTVTNYCEKERISIHTKSSSCKFTGDCTSHNIGQGITACKFTYDSDKLCEVTISPDATPNFFSFKTTVVSEISAECLLVNDLCKCRKFRYYSRPPLTH